ncbi:MAG: hypothetical protein IPO91_23190 [Chloroflexi bacterium]|jgi:hypothetical protein|uniref:hypothetical protein n=1 Tax=Candidatus Flexifilum breve TaxID=3140694 RepID=UPI00313509B8|nr:hypothetical protein [Chloroflexota bacterium]MBK9749663.1 hypothetical protein [Chloroflexota bacterium]
MANPDRTRKLLVRSALVTSATIATFVGAQNLAMLDATRLEALFTPSPEAAIVNPLPEVTTPVPVVRAAPDLVIQQAAPSIIILRRAGQSGEAAANPVASSPVVIQPPAPAEVAAPAPVIVQQPVVQSSRSSR